MSSTRWTRALQENSELPVRSMRSISDTGFLNGSAIFRIDQAFSLKRVLPSLSLGEYIHGQIDKIGNSVEDTQSWLLCQAENVMSGRKSIFSSKNNDLRSRRNISNIFKKILLKSLIKQPKSLKNPTWHQTKTIYGGRTWNNSEKYKTRKAAGFDVILPEGNKDRNIWRWLYTKNNW